jgi:DNA replication protein DnaC
MFSALRRAPDTVTCPHCSAELGVLLCPDGHGRYFRVDEPCTCAEARRETAERLEARRRGTEIAPDTYTVAGIGTHYLTARTYSVFSSYVAAFAPSTSGGLYLTGRTRSGKTYAASAVAIGVARMGYRTRVVTCPNLMQEIRDAYGTKQSEKHVIDGFIAPDLLVIDDLGKEKVTEWSLSMFFSVIDGRLNGDKPLIVTTDRSDQELLERWSVDRTNARAILARLKEMCMKIDMKEVRP